MGGPSNWIRYTNLERYAEQFNIVIVMPDGANSFYLDAPNLPKYETYITKELPTIIENCLRVTTKREHTFIAGLSMGGYGAVHLALAHPNQYSYAASLSGVLDVELLLDGSTQIADPSILFTLNSVPKNSADIFITAKKLVESKSVLPSIYISCGTEDFAYPHHLSAQEKLTHLLDDITFETHRGGHDWDYWDNHISSVLNWLPLKKRIDHKIS